MLDKRNTSYVRRKFFQTAPVAGAAAVLLLFDNGGWADSGRLTHKGDEVKNDRAARLLATIPVPVSADNSPAGGLYSFDISWIDQATEIYYLADRSNKRVDIFDANTGTFLTQLMPRHPSRGFRGPVSRPPTPAQTASLSPGIVCL
jgi:hypothetical protein